MAAWVGLNRTRYHAEGCQSCIIYFELCLVFGGLSRLGAQENQCLHDIEQVQAKLKQIHEQEDELKQNTGKGTI